MPFADEMNSISPMAATSISSVSFWAMFLALEVKIG
jgi:hypothetical protein